MAIDFPNSPTNGQTYTVGNKTWTYNSTDTQWILSSVSPDSGTLTAQGDLLTRSNSALTKLAKGSNGDVLVTDSNATEGLRWQGQYNAGRNAIINGGFDVWQRGTSFTGTSPYYSADRWQAYRASAVAGMTASRQTSGVDGFQYSMRVQRDSGNTGTGVNFLAQSFETSDVRALHNQTLTISFYAKCGANYSPTSSVLNVVVATGTGTETNYAAGFTSEASVINSDVTLTTSYQRFTVTASSTVATTKTQLAVVFKATPTGTASTNDWFEVTGVQLEVGSVASRYDFVPYETTLRKCQRYYYRTTSTASNSTDTLSDIGFAYSTTNATVQFKLPQRMRVKPTSVEYANIQTLTAGGLQTTITSLSINAGNVDIIEAISVQASGLVSGNVLNLRSNGQGVGYIGFGAEL